MDTPIIKAELQYQHNRNDGNCRFPLYWVLVLIWRVGSLIAIAVFIMELIFAILNTNPIDVFVEELLFVQPILFYVFPAIITLPLSVIYHSVLTIRTLLLSSNAVERERQQNTLPLLILSKQFSVQIVMGKWWATILYASQGYVILSFLRVGAIIFLGLDVYRLDHFYYSQVTDSFAYQFSDIPFQVAPLALFVGFAAITWFTFLDLGFTAAIGLLMSSVNWQISALTRTLSAFIIRLLLLLVPSLILIILSYGIVISNQATAIQLYATGSSILENGTRLAAASLTAPRYALAFNIGEFDTSFFHQLP